MNQPLLPSVHRCSLGILPQLSVRRLTSYTIPDEHTIRVRALVPFVCRATCSPPSVHPPQTFHGPQQLLVARNKSTQTRATLHAYATVSGRKAPRPPAVYSSDIRVVTESCRECGGEENAITRLPNIFSDGVSEQASTRTATGEEAHKHNGSGGGGTSMQVHRVLHRSDATKRFHCRLGAIDDDEGGRRKA